MSAAAAPNAGPQARRNYAIVTGAYWADTLADAAQLRDVVDAAHAWAETALAPRSSLSCAGRCRA